MKLVRRNVGETTEARSGVSGGNKACRVLRFSRPRFLFSLPRSSFLLLFLSFLTICRGDFVILEVSLQKIDIEAVYLVG